MTTGKELKQKSTSGKATKRKLSALADNGPPKIAKKGCSPALKKKRPWRDKVRKLAAKKAKQLAALEKKTISADTVGSEPGADKTKKKKRNKKKKRTADDSSNADSRTGSHNDSAVDRLQGAKFRFINEKLYTMKGSEAVEFFKEDPIAYEQYHKGYRKQVRKWPRNPLDSIIQAIRMQHSVSPTPLTIVDMGCGEAKLALSLSETHTVHSYDLVALNERVTACDMAKVPLESGSVDVCVFCLSLMGTNLNEYLREANRMLKNGGTLRIAEVSSRFLSVKSFLYALSKMGFELIHQKNLHDYFLLFEFAKRGKVEQKRPLGLQLNPCLYKKR